MNGQNRNLSSVFDLYLSAVFFPTKYLKHLESLRMMRDLAKMPH